VPAHLNAPRRRRAVLGWVSYEKTAVQLFTVRVSETVGLCAIHGQQAGTYDGAGAMVIQRAIMASAHPEHKPAEPDFGDYDRAFRCAPESKDVAKLRLAECR
jgi:hypothetical protein